MTPEELLEKAKADLEAQHAQFKTAVDGIKQDLAGLRAALEKKELKELPAEISQLLTVTNDAVQRLKSSVSQATSASSQVSTAAAATESGLGKLRTGFESAIRAATTAVGDVHKDVAEQRRILNDNLLSELKNSLESSVTTLQTVVGSIGAVIKGLSPPEPAPSLWGRLSSRHPVAAYLVLVVGVMLLAGSLGRFGSGESLLPTTLVQLNMRILSRAFLFVLAWLVLGAGAGLVKGPSEGEVSSLFRALKYGTAALLASVTVVTGAKVTENFTIADPPQVVFVGSGTVHRFLFSAAEDHGVLANGADLKALELPQGAPLGRHGVRFWSFESGTYDGIGLLTYAYAHHANSQNERRAALVAMSSAHFFDESSGQLTLDRSEQAEVTKRMKTDNVSADSFLVLPLRRNIRPVIYCRRSECESGIDRVFVKFDDKQAEQRISEVGFCGFVPPTGFDFFVSGFSGATRSRLPSKGTCDGGAAPTWVASKAHNFSLDLSHIKGWPSATAPLAFGNLAEGDEDWRGAPCENCGVRDLSLLIPLQEVGSRSGGYEIGSNVCLALQFLDGRDSAARIADYVEFASCQGAPADCTCSPKGDAVNWIGCGSFGSTCMTAPHSTTRRLGRRFEGLESAGGSPFAKRA